MSKQARKHAIGLAGEFLVAGELLRRGIAAAVTYGNAKRSDVIAVFDGRATSIEVKSTSESKWVLGGSLPDSGSKVWVLVFLPRPDSEPPQYFVLTGTELRKLLLPEHEAYQSRYRAKHGKAFEGQGVVSIKRSLLGDEHVGAWQKVARAIAAC